MDNFGECMITVLQVNGIELTIDYELQAQPVYFGDLESEYIEIEINKVVWMGTDVIPLIDALEDTEALKLIIRDRFEDRE